ncbi:MAG: hypothetical protein ACI4TV_05770 [Paludibacteraceae bacterium]
MEHKIAKHLNWYYYGMMILAVVAATLMYLLIVKAVVYPIDPLSTAGKVIQYIIIFDALITIPLGLYGFKRACNYLLKEVSAEHPALTDEIYRKYRAYAAWRIVLVSNSMVFGIVAFYLLGCYQSMLWIAAIGAIGWYFTKPTARKIQIELTPQSNQENY